VTRSRRKPPHTTLSNGDLLTNKSANAIRAAYNAGKGKVTIQGREFTIHRKSENLLVKPVLGRLPMAQIQLVSGPTKKLQKWSQEPAKKQSPSKMRK